MPNFTPNSIIRIGRVPFDNSYAHTMTFANSAAQASYFESVCTQALSRSDYTYVRMNNAIRVPYNAESLYTYNYVMYMNANYGNKWFYAFIVGINYVNENMTELVLELDVMQTWYFDYQLSECFVEREHVNDDTIGAHLNPEPSMELQYIRDEFVVHNVTASYIVVLVNQLPAYRPAGAVAIAHSSYPCSGSVYQNYMCGCKPIIFYNTSAGIAACKKFFEDLNRVGAADTVTNAFMVPSNSINTSYLVQLMVRLDNDDPEGDQEIPLADTYTLADNTPVFYSTPITVPRPTELNGYTPHNNKLFTYPYSYIELGDYSGRIQDYRWEYFKTPATGIFTDKICGISDGIGYVTPKDYNGADVEVLVPLDNMSAEPFTYAFDNKISWTYGVYQNWAAQNAVGNQLAVLGGIAAIAGGVGLGMNAAVAAGQAAGDLAAYRISQQTYDKKMHSLQHQIEPARNMAIGGAGAIGGTYANIERMRRQPNIARGNTAGNSKYQNGYAGWYSCQMVLRAEFAEIADRFFDMYGYQVDIVKTPNRTGRPYWNYVKTANAAMYGNVPADDMAKINSIYNSGITFWHTSDIGNYSLDNRLS